MGEKYFIVAGEYQGDQSVKDIIAGLAQFDNKHCHENSERVRDLLTRLLEFRAR